MNVLVGVTGSVAAIKAVELVAAILAKEPRVKIRIVVTARGRQFLKPDDLSVLARTCEKVHFDEHEWTEWSDKGDPVLHIELRKWTDILLLAPLSANTLAKISNGLCDNLLTSVIRAWDPSKRMIICPAMNTFMWENPFTSRQLETVVEVYGAAVVPPKEEYVLACGDLGAGAMAAVPDIVAKVFEFK